MRIFRGRTLALVVLAALVLAGCGSGDEQTASTTTRKPRATTTTSTTELVSEATTTTAAPAPVTMLRPKTAPAPRTPTTRRASRPATTAAPAPVPASNPGPVAVPNETPRATLAATVFFTGGGTGYAAYLNLHDAHANAVAMGAQLDQGDPPSSGKSLVHANYVRSGTFGHAYGEAAMPLGQASRWELRYYDGAGQAVFFRDGTPLLAISVKFTGQIFYQTEVNARLDGDSVDATFDNVVMGGTQPGNKPVIPSGGWNTRDFDFWRLDMQQTNGSVVQGANMRGFGTIGGMNGGNWHTVNPPAAAIGMIAEQY